MTELDAERPARVGDAATFPTLSKRLLGVQVVDAILDLIVAGKLLPGQSLPAERDLAPMLGVSRPLVREAIRALTTLNVLETRHGEGTYVTSLDPVLLLKPLSFLLRVDEETLFQMFEVRTVLEVHAASLAAVRIDARQLAELDEMLAVAARNLDSVEAFVEMDHKIHARIIVATGNQLYIRLCESVAELGSGPRTAGPFLSPR